MLNFTETHVEEAALAWLEDLGWLTAHGPGIAPGMPVIECCDAGDDPLDDVGMPKLRNAQS